MKQAFNSANVSYLFLSDSLARKPLQARIRFRAPGMNREIRNFAQLRLARPNARLPWNYKMTCEALRFLFCIPELTLFSPIQIAGNRLYVSLESSNKVYGHIRPQNIDKLSSNPVQRFYNILHLESFAEIQVLASPNEKKQTVS